MPLLCVHRPDFFQTSVHTRRVGPKGQMWDPTAMRSPELSGGGCQGAGGRNECVMGQFPFGRMEFWSRTGVGGTVVRVSCRPRRPLGCALKVVKRADSWHVYFIQVKNKGWGHPTSERAKALAVAAGAGDGPCWSARTQPPSRGSPWHVGLSALRPAHAAFVEDSCRAYELCWSPSKHTTEAVLRSRGQ